MKGFVVFELLVLVAASVLCGFGMSKECTNIPTQLSSHTFRYALLSSNNESLKQEMFAHYHLTPTDDSVWSSLLPRKMLKEEDEFDWAMMYKKLKSPLQSSGNFLKEVSLHNVRLDLGSFHWRAQQTNLEYLLMLNLDRLVWSFRKTAGLPTPGTAYGGWEAPNVELRGHFVLAGLLDQYIFADNAQALKMVNWMVEYFYNRVQNVITKYSVERHFLSLNEETGGMNDVLYKLFSITGEPKHLVLAHLFDKPCFLGLLAVQEIGTFFMDIVNSSHTYATGGTSDYEFWSDPKRLASTLNDQTEESCTTYNMLKVSRHLFRWTKEMAYADYYERALTNGVLGIQRGTEPGVMIYLLPQNPGGSKARTIHKWGTPDDSFWCCYGTGIESFSKLGDSIYFEEGSQIPGLYVIQYISSSLDWKLGQIVLNQKVDPIFSWDPFLRVTFTFDQGASQSSTLNLRIPIWTHSDDVKATINAQSLPVPPPGNFLSVTGSWSSSDKLFLQLPIILRTEAIKDDRPEYASIQAILFGPYLLAGHSSGDWDLKSESAKSLSDWITAIPATYNSHLVSFSQDSGDSVFALTNSNQSLTMEIFPQPGTDDSVHATFRLILNDSSSSELANFEDAVGKLVMLEPFNLPGMLLVQQGKEVSLAVGYTDGSDGSSLFRLVSGLDGKDGSVSLESVSNENCFVFSGVDYKSGTALKLSCKKSSETKFNQGASFMVNKGISHYHPISFVAKGAKRNFLLSPLFSFRDESYTIYFNIQA
ncbi:conserved hypothetical protein [Ricinus communis]|uniref:Alpha-L-arabinofuranosidase B arabinose-binding domain-containing protein n=1 Tax=Ricinus communis TaxID=3988 RepID=B9RI94_RICCO|nr:conserved hypothetical protein [Ricinus communis]